MLTPAGDYQFLISKAHMAHADHWIRTHPCRLRKSKRTTAIGGKISFRFTDTSIGQLQVVLCACGKEELLNGDEL